MRFFFTFLKEIIQHPLERGGGRLPLWRLADRRAGGADGRALRQRHGQPQRQAGDQVRGVGHSVGGGGVPSPGERSLPDSGIFVNYQTKVRVENKLISR